MVNNLLKAPSRPVPGLARPLVTAYVVISLGTLAVLAVLSARSPDLAGREAWVHAVIVGVFAAVLPLRLRSAHRGSERGWVAVVVIAGVLAIANVVEAALPSPFPGWMRIEMLVMAALMVVLVASFARSARSSAHPQ
jgi:hypothetical protein